MDNPEHSHARRSFWAWCLESEEPTDAERAELARRLSERSGRPVVPRPVPDLADAQLRAPRLTVPDALADWCRTDTWERAFHAYGAAFTDRTRAFNLDFPNPPDVVAHPRTEAEVEATLDWCAGAGHVVVPYGGGSSVVWGVNPPEADGIVTIALDRLDRVLEIDETSRAARIQAGVFGPDLEDQLRPHGYTLRHFPQSFRFSSLGGWIVTRSGGHYATNHTHIDDFVESVRMLTPRGWWESRRLPGSGAGPSPDRLVLGSEGILGIVTEAWMRIQARPTYRATAGVVFDTWEAGYEAARHVVQAKLWPANLRLLDPAEAGRAAGLDGVQALLIIGFESAELSQRGPIGQAVEIARQAGGHIDDADIAVSDGAGEPTGRGGAVGAWRDAFIGVRPGAETSLDLV
ncbi:MAG: FAD-binding oxidoreductase, partial [Mycobacteriales bacterium]